MDETSAQQQFRGRRRGRGLDRQVQDEGRTLARLGLHLGPAAVQFDQSLDQGQGHTRPAAAELKPMALNRVVVQASSISDDVGFFGVDFVGDLITAADGSEALYFCARMTRSSKFTARS